MKTKEQLTNERNELHAKLNEVKFKETEWQEVLKLLKQNEEELQKLETAKMLSNVNSKYARLRDMAKQVWNCEQPTEDITTSDGSFHKTKVKKYPILAAMQYCYGQWKDEKLVEIRYNGERFRMFIEKYEYNKPTEYTRPETFEKFLEHNSIPVAEITAEEFAEFTEKLDALNAELEKAIKTYGEGINALKVHSFNYWGLAGQQNTHLYKYSANKR